MESLLSARSEPDPTTGDTTVKEPTRILTGIPGLDEVLSGGLPANHLYLIDGEPGSGKTTIALHFLLEGRAKGERGLYVTLSESSSELRGVAQSHGWSLDGIEIFELSSDSEAANEEPYTLFHPSEVELQRTLSLVFAVIERHQPSRVVIDSLSELRLLARDALRFRRQKCSSSARRSPMHSIARIAPVSFTVI